MIITNDFVFINYPKTGSTFVRKVFNDIFEVDAFSLLKKNWVSNQHFESRESDNIRDFPLAERWLKPTPHGLRCQIPEEHKDKKVVSVIRNPFERLVSLYEYGDWKKNFWLDESEIQKKYKNYPEISFAEFLEIRRDYPYFNYHPYNNTFPNHTTFFLNFFFFFNEKDPIAALNNWTDNSLMDFKKGLKGVTFLKNENLNEELYLLLKEHNYPERYISNIINAKKVNISKKADKSYLDYYDDQTLAMVKQEAKLVLDIFPDYLKFAS